MLTLSRVTRSRRYTPVVGCAFLVETLYGSKYSANLGLYNMPYVYVKTLLLCATGSGLKPREGRYIHGLVELLLPSKVSQDNLTKLELLQFVDAIPMDRCAGDNDDSEGADEEEAEEQATLALMLRSSDGASGADAAAAATQAEYSASSSPPFPDECRTVRHARQVCSDGRCRGSVGGPAYDGEGDGPLPCLGPRSTAAGGRRSRAEEAVDDVAAVESIMSFVSATAFPSSIARVLIYDAVCTCLSDGLYSAKEKERVALVSSHIGLSSAVRDQIEKLALQEKVISIRKRRLLLLRPFLSNTMPTGEERRLRAFSALSGATKNSMSQERRRGEAGGASSSEGGYCGDRQDAEDEADTLAAEEAMQVEAAKTLLRRARARRLAKRYAGI
ncbi:hypothetical protein GH5_05432 [Leishmania sp. Ghana 2012 LV757]|uniref:hypothetical protein n=1 Tax=Leishmania sp. Ghana 2012 LV757 TaxID=2803181 RepID=UPI001B41C9D2|nr:hypothetical protein GH5_05432 [Leishmania sp. Ghana 2012 LV757]